MPVSSGLVLSDILINRMRSLGYESDPKGICFGTAYMAMQAAMVGDLEHFNQRLALMGSIPEKNFKQESKEVQALRLKAFTQFKKNEIPYHSLSQNEKDQFEKTELIQRKLKKLNQTINELIIEGKLPEAQRTEEWNKRKVSLLISEFRQSQWLDEMNHFNPRDKMMLEMEAFFIGVELYHNPKRYPELFKETISNQEAGASFVFPLVSSEKMETQEEIQIVKFTGVYDLENLHTYFETLKIPASKSGQPVAFVLSSVDHAICVSYDPYHGSWAFTDPNQLPTQYIPLSDTYTLANKVLAAFAFNKKSFVAFQTTACLHLSDCGLFGDVSVQSDWKKIHDPFSQSLNDLNKSAWLELAIDLDDVQLVKSLLKDETNVNMETEDGGSLLFKAIDGENIELVKMLLEHKANPNVFWYDDDKEEFTPLFDAVTSGFYEIAKILLEKGAKPNTMCDGETPLFAAVRANDLELTKLLLEKHANPNLGCKEDGGATPLFKAVQNESQDILELLLKVPKIDTNKAFKTTADSLRYFFAKRGPAEGRAQKFIERFQDKENILITPQEMAQIIGNTKIITLLKKHHYQQSKEQQNKKIYLFYKGKSSFYNQSLHKKESHKRKHLDHVNDDVFNQKMSRKK